MTAARIGATAAVLALTIGSAAAQSGLDALMPAPGAFSGQLLQVAALLTALSVGPALLIMVTSFTRFVVALSFLRAGLGLPSTPANIVLITLARFMTVFIMAPVFDRAWTQAAVPFKEGRITESQAAALAVEPFRSFMKTHVRDKDLRLFEDLAPAALRTAAGAEPDLRLLVPAFMISELRRGFEIGFLIILPFLIIDMVVATLAMAMGMMMLPPTVVALPVKILFFVLIDGWSLVIGSLLRSYG